MTMAPVKDDRSNVIPIRQPSLFDEPSNDNAVKRVDPRRALLRFRVRREVELDDDIPLEESVQHGLFDADEDRTFVDIIDGQAISDREFLRLDVGSDDSGHRRAAFCREKNAALAAWFHRMKAESYEDAVCALFSKLSRDPAYMSDNPPLWILRLFVDERQLLIETFSGRNKEWLFPASPADDDSEDP